MQPPYSLYIKKRLISNRDLYYGTNGANYVYSFLTSDGSTLNSFNGDLNDYLTVRALLLCLDCSPNFVA